MGLIHHLNPLEYKAIGVLDFEIRSPMHIGVGEGGVRRAFLKIAGGDMLIPSSTWKGAFRFISESIAKSMGFKDELAKIAVESFREEARAAYEVDEQFCEEMLGVLRGCESSIIPYTRAGLIELAGELGFSLEEVREIEDRGFGARDNLIYRFAESLIAAHCPIGRLYGNHVLAGKVRFLDTLLKPEAGKLILHERAGVAIDRYSGKIRERALFILEGVVGSGGVRLKIIADNLTLGADDSRLFALTLDAVGSFGLNLGARKSTGMGWLELRDESSHWYIINLRKDEGGVKIGNPFKYAEKRSIKEFLEWLQMPTEESNKMESRGVIARRQNKA